jgi:hypothetical protein
VRSLSTADSWAWVQRAGLCGLHEQLISQRPGAGPRHRDPRAGPIGDVAIDYALAGGLPLADALARADGADAVVPEELHRLGETTGYHVAVTWGAQPGTWMPSSPIDPHRRHTPTADRPEVPRILFLVGCEGRGWLARRFGGVGEGGLVLGW